MTLDELLAQLKAKHGSAWAGVAFERMMYLQLISDGEDRLELALLMHWAKSTIVAATWQPGPEVWAMVPYDWIAGRRDGLLDAFEEEPQLFPDQWWSRAGKVWHVGAELLLGIDWRTAKWKRPEAIQS